jgi:Icc-related predicted phosphoesterase
VNVLATADLHWNHSKSRESAAAIIEEMNAQHDVDALLIVGDVGVADGDSIEECLSRFTFTGPKLFVPGNHELWTKRDGVDLLGNELPRRISAAGWHWLPGAPFVRDGMAIVGALGWYDYLFAAPSLEIPLAFYEAKASPGAVIYSGEPAELVGQARASSSAAQELVARWNDGKFVRLDASDEEIVARECAAIERSLDAVAHARSVLVATHTVPFADLLPPHHGGQWDFARAYLGSPRLGETIGRFENVSHVICGHSHFAAEANVGRIKATNLGSGYRAKRFARITL